MANLLITYEDILVYRPTAELDPKRIDPFILEAQEMDLQPVLNGALYLDFINKFNVTGDAMYTKYQELLNGKNYSYNGYTVPFPGVKPMLCYFALARFVRSNPVNVVRFGVTVKRDEKSDPASPELIQGFINDLRSVAIRYQNEVIKFLVENSTDYPLYNYLQSSESAVSTSFNFFKG